MAFVLENQIPAPGAENVAIDAPVSFDLVWTEVTDFDEGTVLLSDFFRTKDLSSQVDGILSTFALGEALHSGTLHVWMDGIKQAVASEDHEAGTFTLAFVPALGAKLQVYYIQRFYVQTMDFESIGILFDDNGVVEEEDLIFDEGSWLTGFDGTITPILGGYHFEVTTHPDFLYGTDYTVYTGGEGPGEAGNSGPLSWTFKTVLQIYHAHPYFTSMDPVNGGVNVDLDSSISFIIRSDDIFTPVTAIIVDEIKLNDTTIILAGANVLPSDYDIDFTYDEVLRQVLVEINPLVDLDDDTVYVISGHFHDNAGAYGADSFAFNTGSATYAMQLDRQEPLIHPIDNIPAPLFDTEADVVTNAFSDTIASPTTDWAGWGVVGYDEIEVSGPEAGRWIVRSPGITEARLYKVFSETNTGLVGRAFRRQEFADRNPIDVVFSPLFPYKLEKIWGPTQLRYLSGYASDSAFPAGFNDVPTAAVHDANNRISGSAEVTVGSADVVGVGTTFTDLSAGSRLRFGGDPEVFTVLSIADDLNLTLTGEYARFGQVDGLVAVSNSSAIVVGTGTQFTEQIVADQGVKFGDNTTQYTVLSVDSDTQITLTATYGETSDPAVSVKVTAFPGLAIFDLDESCGGSFDDQTNKRLNFDIVNNPATDSSHWDRYGITFAAKIRPQITGTASLTNGDTLVSMSSSTFKGELHVGAILTFGTSTDQYQVTDIDDMLDEFTISPAWADTTAEDVDVQCLIGGTRVLQVIHVTEMMELTEFFVGLVGSGASPTLDSHDRIGCSFARLADDSIELRAHLGSSTAIKNTGLSLADFIGKDWMLEIELVDTITVDVRLFSFDDLESALPNMIVTVQNAALPAANPTLDRWTLTTLSEGAAPLNYAVRGWVSYVDVEPGQAVPFDLGTAVVTSMTAKARAARNIYKIPVVGEYGWKILNSSAGFDTTAFTGTQSDQIFWDEEVVTVIIDNFAIDGDVVESLSNPTRQVRKFSFNQGFDQIHVTFRASRRGYWYVLADSSDPLTGLVLARGMYDVSDATQSVTIDSLKLGGLADGLHVIHVVLAKEPVPFSWSYLTGVSFLHAGCTLIESTSATLTGKATVTAVGTVS